MDQAHRRNIYYRLIAAIARWQLRGPAVDDRGRVMTAEYNARVNWLQDKARRTWRER